jgi:hypothetical protein
VLSAEPGPHRAREPRRASSRLLLFALGARALPLSPLGFVQYVSPSLQFLLGVLVYRERFTVSHAFGFAFIWTALALLTVELRRRLRIRPRATPPNRYDIVSYSESTNAQDEARRDT